MQARQKQQMQSSYRCVEGAKLKMSRAVGVAVSWLQCVQCESFMQQ